MKHSKQAVGEGASQLDHDDWERSHDRFIREEERRKVTGLSRSTWWRLERIGGAPKRRRLAPNSTGWLFSEIRDWMKSRAAGAS